MTQWEYTEERWDANRSLSSQLNVFGKEGWELVKLTHYNGYGTAGEWYNRHYSNYDPYYVGIFKRPR